MKKCIFVVILAIFTSGLSAQSAVDSLETELSQAVGTQKSDLLIALAAQVISVDQEKGLQYAQQALQTANEFDYMKGQAEALSYLGLGHSLSRDDEQAVVYFQKALELSGIDEFDITGNTYFWLGTSYRNLGKNSEAFKAVRTSLTIYSKQNNKPGRADALNSLGMIFWRTGKYDRSLVRFNEALTLRKSLGDTSLTAATYNNIGVVHYQRAHYELALNNYLASLRLREKIGDKKGVALVLANVGKTYKDLGKIDEAMNYFMQSLTASSKMNDNRLTGYALNNIGSVFEVKGDYDSSLVYYERSLERYRDYKGLGGMILNMNSIANNYNLLGEYEKALEYSKQAYEKALEVEYTESQATALRNMGISYLNLREPDSALEKFNQSLRLSLSIGQRELVKENYAHISGLYSDRGDDRNALVFFKRYGALKDSLIDEDVTINIDRLKIKYETERKEQENEMLRAETEGHLAIISRNHTIIGLISILLVTILVFTIVFYGMYGHKKKANVLLENKNKELENAMSRIKILSGLLPICASCKKIRDDHGYWNEVSSYITEHSEAIFSHGICPECIVKLYPDYVDDNKESSG